MAENDNGISRRNFLDYLIGGTVTVGAVAFTSAAVSFWYPPETEVRRRDKIDIGPLESLPPGESKKVDFNGEPVIVMRLTTGIYALSAVCTHLGCIVDWDKGRQQVVCPCHEGVFDYRGNVLSGPPPKPLRSLQVDIQGGNIVIGNGGKS